MDNSQFESILDHLGKMVKSKENIGIALMELVDDVDAIQEIHRQAEMQMKMALNSYSGYYMTDQSIVFISLSLIALLQYDGSYYDKVLETYSGLYLYSEQKIQGVIRDVLYHFSPPELRKNSSRIINAALFNAIVPVYYLKSFFDFIYDIYKINFEYTLSEELDEDFQFVYDGLRDVMNSKGDKIKVGVTKKTYKLIESTKRLITDKDGVLAVIELSKRVVRLIDQRVWTQKIQFENSYLKQGFDAWDASLQSEKENIRNKVRERNSGGVRSHWKSKYILDGNQVFLVPPIHRIRSTYDYRTVRLVVKNNDKIIYSDERPDIREIIGGYELVIQKIPVRYPIGHVRYQILAGEGNDIIYDSKDNLFRNCLVFDELGSEINNHTDYSGMAIFCLKSKCSDCGDVYYYDQFGGYLLAIKKVNEGDICDLNTEVFCFSSSGKPGIYGEKREHYALKNMDSGEVLTLYENVKGLFFISEDDSSKYELVLDGVHRKLEDYSVQTTPHMGRFKYVVDLSKVKDGIHHIQLNSLRGGRKRQILAQNFASDKNLHTKCESRAGNSYIVSVKSSLLSAELTEEIDVNTFQEDWLTFCVGKTNFSLRIPFDFDFYRVNGGAWRSFSDYLWIDDIQADSTLDVYGGEINELRVISNDGILLEEEITLTDRGLFQQVRTGFLQSFKKLHDYVRLEFNNGKRKKTLLCYYRCVLNTKKTEISCDPADKSMQITTEYYGNGKIFFRVVDDDKEIFHSGYLQSGAKVVVSGLLAFRHYAIYFFEREKGLQLQRERELAVYKRYFYSYDDLPGRTFRIKEIELYYEAKGHMKHQACRLRYETYIYFKSTSESKNAYYGNLYLVQDGTKSVYKYLNPVRIDICGKEKGGKLELAITKDGDGLLYDENRHKIMPVLEDKNAYDIFTYTIDLREG